MLAFLMFSSTFSNALDWTSNLPVSNDQTFKLLKNRGYMVGYSECRRSPLWVSYPLAKKRYKKYPKRRPPFREDIRTNSHVSPDDYWYSDYDRGHLAPAYAVWSVSGPQARTETFRMSNIVPQKKRLNQKLWQRLEEVATTYFVKEFPEITVYTGPVYAQPNFLDSGIRIPDALFKIFIGEKHGKLFSLAFVMPQEVKGDEPLDDFVRKIDDIEAMTGLDFLANLKDSVEIPLESVIDIKPWNLEAVSNLPARY